MSNYPRYSSNSHYSASYPLRSAIRSAAPSRQSVNNEPRSQLVDAILQSANPVQLNETEQITINGVRGIYANRAENAQFRGPLPLEQYALNEDPNPEVIRKKPTERVKYTQEVAVRYLNPPPAPRPGDLIVRERQQQLPPAPALVVRQEGRDAATPAPLVYREAPPRPPSVFDSKVVRIEGKQLPPPPRRVIVERFPEEPQKPAPIIIERWLPYKPRKVKVIYQRVEAPECGCDVCQQQQQQQPQYVQYEQAVPQFQQQQQQQQIEYISAPAPTPAPVYQSPAPAYQSPAPVYQAAPTPARSVAVASYQQQQRRTTPAIRSSTPAVGGLNGLEGDAQALDALRRVDLDRYGLGEYRKYL